ncbi:MAG TPA: hypothetical protein VKA46_09455 [Gemmataceae bacterium]|nr:hypothetical protein [Gemmataceae bacterium]
MIANADQLKVAARNLRILEGALTALRKQLEISNPALLEITSKAYERRVASLQADIVQYLAQHPAEVSSILPPLEQPTAVTTPVPTA